jgi:lipoprotein-anchoring transpeptidase ErfK/SrfK
MIRLRAPILGALLSVVLLFVSVPHAQAQGFRSIDVNLSTQTARAIEGGQVVYTAGVTTGRPGWRTPTGHFSIKYRVFDETMDSSSIGIPRNAPGGYYLTGVLYTQYFDWNGTALHYNYWSPASAFGGHPTSHGCVGMPLAAARFFWNFASVGTPVTIHY